MQKLSEIKLEEITREEFHKRKAWWGGEKESNSQIPKRKGTIYSQITNPISVEIDDTDKKSRERGYLDFMLELFHNDEVFRISVNNQGRWRRLEKKDKGYIIFEGGRGKDEENRANAKVRQIEHIKPDSDFLDMVKTAANDKDHYNYLDAVIGFEGSLLNRPFIRFVEYTIKGKKRIIGYEMRFKRKFSSIFQVVSYNINYHICKCVYVPEEYETLPSPASVRERIK